VKDAAAMEFGAGPVSQRGGEQDLHPLLRAIAEAGDLDVQFSFAFEDAVALFGESLMIDADPRQLHLRFFYEIECGGQKLDPSQYFLGTGDWSGFLRPIEASPVYAKAVQLKEANPAFRRTRSYKHLRKTIAGGRFPVLNHVKMDSPDKLDAHFRNFRRMLNSAARHGIKRRPLSRIDDDPGRYPLNEARPLWTELSERDVGVAIDRDGRMHCIGPGKHRTAVAKVLGLERMPCEVRMVHVDWLRRMLPDFASASQFVEAIHNLAPFESKTDRGEKM